ncbi:uncharacterized protein LOC142975701 [Anticarsia gemmatalis]|uniref:uncharacterized protein LOC142975701 n=1 Tax=Anticarsia gemmatalis TaxID=129554 RepID=UPI003F76946B
MFSQPPEDEQNDSKNLQTNPRRRRIKSHKNKNKNKRKGNKKKPGNISKPTVPLQFSNYTMSSWAESFTHAATWQLKHQVAYWKSKATALEYENRLLHEIIRKNYTKGQDLEVNVKQERDVNIKQESDNEDIAESTMESHNEEEAQEDDEDVNFEVSEEFIQFLMNNKKYKDDAKRERERLKALYDTDQQLLKEMEATPVKDPEDNDKVLQELYGERWQRIAALETSVQSQFLSDCDKDKPEYWPNIPLNFN